VDDVNLQAQMENRRKRRKESNRESARRSRLRKQQHLDDLDSQVGTYIFMPALTYKSKNSSWCKHAQIHFFPLYIYAEWRHINYFPTNYSIKILNNPLSWYQVNQLKDQNKQLGVALRVTSQNLVAVQAQNSVLQTQKMELESRLGPLTEILLYLNSGGTAASTAGSAVNTAAAFMNNNSLATTSGACDVLGASTWSQPVDLYYRCF
jgi:hypothetical protein